MPPRTHGQTFYEEGERKLTLTYRCWRGMKQRCDNPNTPGFAKYGGRGVSYDPRWKEFGNFWSDMGDCPDGYELGRIDNNKGYEKDNCRWETRIQQMNNRGIFKNNKSGITGVSFHTRFRKWQANAREDGRQITLYNGRDFFEACCARKSWEAKVRVLILEGK